MRQRQATKLSESFDLPNPGLRAYLSHVVEGNREVYRPPFWKKEDPASVLNAWEKVLANTDVKTKYPSLYKYELEMKGKVGPMSYQLPLKDRLKDVENYYTMVGLPSKPISSNAVQAAGEYLLGDGGVRIRSVDNTIAKMRLDTSSGSPYFGRRSRYVEATKQILRPDSMDYDTQFSQAAVLGWRGQEGGPSVKDTKQRVVWMFPFAVNVRELQFYQPFIEAVQTRGTVPAWISNDAVDQAITNTWKWKSPEVEVICTDFSKFDQHFNRDMAEASHQLYSMVMSDGRLEKEWLNHVFPQKYEIPIICSEEITYTGHHGMASGSGGTNCDETGAHKALQFEAAELANDVLCPYSQDIGDDGYLCSEKGLSVEHVTKTYTAHGQEMNPDKQYVSAHDCIYLRRWHGEDYTKQGIMVGVYPTFRALGRLLYQERFYDPDLWGPKMVELRAWSILENCNHHPCFEEFVDFVMKGDKYRLGLDIPGFIQDIGHLASEATEVMPDFLGYNRSQQKQIGITQWSIYRYLKSKA